jgi:hypothetical protein
MSRSIRFSVTGSPIRRPRKQGGEKGWAEKDAQRERTKEKTYSDAQRGEDREGRK